MDDHKSDGLGTTLAYETYLPLRWTTIDALPEASVLHHLQESNADLLRTIAVLDEYAPELADEDPVIAHEIRQLDFKLNIVLKLIGQILLQQAPLPASAIVRLQATEIEWDCPQALSAGTAAKLEVYLNTQYPQPLTVFTQITSALPAEKNHFRIKAEFQQFGVAAQDWLEKIIFLHHRRQIAHARHG